MVFSVSNTLPLDGVMRISGSNDLYMSRISPSKPLNTDSRITIAMTGTATATALTPEMTLITECDFFENRYLRANSSERCGMGYCLRSLSISLMYSSESSR